VLEPLARDTAGDQRHVPPQQARLVLREDGARRTQAFDNGMIWLVSHDQPSFRPALFTFLRELREHNDREWFQANKSRYTDTIQEPALEFIRSFGPELRKISPHFRAEAKPVGGSLFRIYRDTRFSHDKTPYKTHVGIHFRHVSAKDAHAPVYYLHLEPGDCFLGVGIWRPDTATAKRIRAAIAADAAEWKRAVGGRFGATYELRGDSLKRPPAGIDPDHPLIDDIKRKDFIGMTELAQRTVTAPDFVREFAGLCRAGSPLMRFLCGAVGVPF
jgi:uncharacterized protein (TIGR02453 family)